MLEIVRGAAMEASLATAEYITGTLPVERRDAFATVRDPVAALANLNRAIVQIVLAEERLDETDAQRSERRAAEAEARVKAEHAAATEHSDAERTLRRAENKRDIQQAVRAITLTSISQNYSDRETMLAKVFADIEREDVYDGDPAEVIADLCVRLGFAHAKPQPDTEARLADLTERKTRMVALARAHLEALRGPHDPETGDDSAPFAPPTQAQGPPH